MPGTSSMRNAVMAFKQSALTKLDTLAPIFEPLLEVIKTHPKITLAVLGPPSAIVLFLLSLVSLNDLFRVVVAINFFAFSLVFSLLGAIISLVIKLSLIIVAIASLTALSTAVVLGSALSIRMAIGAFRIPQRISEADHTDQHTSPTLDSGTPISATPSFEEWNVELQNLKKTWNAVVDWWTRTLPIIESTTIEVYRIALPLTVGAIRVSIFVVKAAFMLLKNAYQSTVPESSPVNPLFSFAPEELGHDVSTPSETTQFDEGRFPRRMAEEGATRALPFIITVGRLSYDISKALVLYLGLIWRAMVAESTRLASEGPSQTPLPLEEIALGPLERHADEHLLDEEFEDVGHAQAVLIEGKEERQDIQLVSTFSEQDLKHRGAFSRDDDEDA